MKMVKSDWRSKLRDAHLTDLMLVCIETNVISSYDPEPAVHLWNSCALRARRPYHNERNLKVIQDLSIFFISIES
jgi:hypothetical protein